MPVPDLTTSTTLINLPERTQAALIRELGSKVDGDPAALLQLLATPIEEPSEPQRTIDRTVFRKRVVISLENRSLQPADRIDRAVVILTPDPPATFVKWSQFATKYSSVNLGSLDWTQTAEKSLDLTVSPTFVQGSAEAKGHAKSVQDLKESLTLTKRFVEASGSLTPKEARFIQDGSFGMDLTGNVAIDFTIRAVNESSGNGEITIYRFGQLFDPKDTPKAADTIKFERQTARYVKPQDCHPVLAKSQLESTLRSATKGAQSIIEGDDHAEYRQNLSEATPFVLIDSSDLRFSVWWIVDAKNDPLQIARTNNPSVETIFFASYDDAASFLKYLASPPLPSIIGGRQIFHGTIPSTLTPAPLTAAKLPVLQVEIKKLNWETGACSN